MKENDLLQRAGKNVLFSPLWMQTMKNLSLEKANKGKNLVYSPLSIYFALGLLSSGAKGETLNQLIRFLKSGNLNSLNGFCSQVINSLSETQLSLANSVWVEESCVLKPKFEEVASSVFGAHVQAVDFRHKADEVRLIVNQWVETKTNGLIKDLLQQGVLNSLTTVVLVNALYFKGLWHKGQFDKSSTENSKFYLLDRHPTYFRRQSVEVPFMTTKQKYQYILRGDGYKVLKLPYKLEKQKAAPSYNRYYDDDLSDRRFSMYIILPDRVDGLVELIDKANTDSGSFLNKYIPERVPFVRTGEFKVPKFKITFAFDAKEVLSELGLSLALGPGAELTEMVGAAGFISMVIHKCFVEVDEEGTEGAVATCVAFHVSRGIDVPPPPLPPVVDFVADHPFMFIIKDGITGILLFTGYVLNPLLDS